LSSPLFHCRRGSHVSASSALWLCRPTCQSPLSSSLLNFRAAWCMSGVEPPLLHQHRTPMPPPIPRHDASSPSSPLAFGIKTRRHPPSLPSTCGFPLPSKVARRLPHSPATAICLISTLEPHLPHRISLRRRHHCNFSVSVALPVLNHQIGPCLICSPPPLSCRSTHRPSLPP
jgi:hypothetical protein